MLICQKLFVIIIILLVISFCSLNLRDETTRNMILRLFRAAYPKFVFREVNSIGKSSFQTVSKNFVETDATVRTKEILLYEIGETATDNKLQIDEEETRKAYFGTWMRL